MINASDILHAKILIVDDQGIDILSLGRMLVSAGYTSITSTKDTHKIFELHREHHYDLILLDLEMHGMSHSGFQVLEGLKKIEPDGYLPVIVMTAQPGNKLRAFQAGARDFISKPFDLSEVLARVRNMLEARLSHLETKTRISTLEQRVREVEADRDLLRRQYEEVKRRYDKSVSMEAGGSAAALIQPQLHREARLRTLLYVEDNPADLRMVEQLIARHADIRLLSAVNGNSGIETARIFRPAVIMMDINLPDMSGFQALEILRSDHATAHIPVIAFSANTTPLNIESGLEAGFFRYLTKPIEVDEFMDVLDVAMKFSRSRSADQ